jgi:secreted Zn-dependent insulinase-like peptidase
MPRFLQVIAVSDPAADRAAASMDVSVGSFSDPDKFPGTPLPAALPLAKERLR